MKVGIEIRRFVTPEEDAGIAALVAGMARAADQGGLDSLWVMDHFFQIPGVGAAEEPMLEGVLALGFLAGSTERIALGTLVTGVTYRHPGFLVKTVTTLDVLSGGRAWLGIGAAWYEREHLGLGVPFPPRRRALRAPRGDAADRPADVVRRGRPLRGAALPSGRDALLAAAAVAPAPADPDRRRRRAEDAAPGRPLRRRLQPLRIGDALATLRAQARRAARALRAARVVATRRSRRRPLPGYSRRRPLQSTSSAGSRSSGSPTTSSA